MDQPNTAAGGARAYRDPMMPRDPMQSRDPMMPRGAMDPMFRPRHERQFETAEGLRSPKRRALDVQHQEPILLSDEQVAHFIANGYLVLDPTLPPEFHAAVFDKFLDIAGRDSDNDTGNNILPVVPEIHEVFEDPVVKGALQSVLGPRYFLHPHRALHTNPPGTPPQAFHHDTYWGYKRKVHNHHPYWVMVMYYPQKLFPEIGPTGVVPGTHTIAQRLDDIEQIEVPGQGAPGTCIMIHFDIWHRKMQNFTDQERFMLKCQFVRLERPKAPTWNNQRRDWVAPAKLPAYRMEPVWREHWEWLSGRQGSAPVVPQAAGDLEGLGQALASGDAAARREAIAAIATLGAAAAPLIPALIERLDDVSEPVGLSAAYAIGAMGKIAIRPLVAAMLANDGENVDDARVFIDEGQKSEMEMRARNAAHGLVAIGREAVPALLAAFARAQPRARKYIAFALGEIDVDSKKVHDVLAQMASDTDENVRINAIEALGLKQGSPAVIAALEKALDDDEDEVRFNAALSFARLGPRAKPATDALIRALNDGNRYVLGYTVEALERIGTEKAMAALMRHLKQSRWCPMTNNRSLF